MATLWLRLRADVRMGWRTLAALALLLGLVGGVVLTAAAGARRTDTAYPRLLSWASATQVDILPFSGEPAPRYYAAMARLRDLTRGCSSTVRHERAPVLVEPR